MQTIAQQVALGISPYIALYAAQLTSTGSVDAWVAGPADTNAGHARDEIALFLEIDPSRISMELINGSGGLFAARFRMAR